LASAPPPGREAAAAPGAAAIAKLGDEPSGRRAS